MSGNCKTVDNPPEIVAAMRQALSAQCVGPPREIQALRLIAQRAQAASGTDAEEALTWIYRQATGTLNARGEALIDPTQRGDEIAGEMRAYYEANKPRWWQRRYNPECADNLMIGLLNIALARTPDTGGSNDREG